MTVQTLPATVPDSVSATLRVVMKPVESIHPYENNPRYNDSAVPYVKNSIQEFGFKVPIIVDEAGSIVCGHTRYKAALELGMSHVPCIVASDLTPKQIQAFRLVDNKVSEFSSWDFSKLEIEIGELDAEFNLDDFGFSPIQSGREARRRMWAVPQKCRMILRGMTGISIQDASLLRFMKLPGIVQKPKSWLTAPERNPCWKRLTGPQGFRMPCVTFAYCRHAALCPAFRQDSRVLRPCGPSCAAAHGKLLSGHY